ncbi:MAG: type II toxin-antitoxin system RelE/ParE family toxin [Lautropia sp.]|nr:type II toxin-antitoxin system RelE/ParE family toxin [Lautropia sp.]
MMLPIVWSVPARNDLANIVDFIADRNPAAARKIRALIESSLIPASAMPYMFKSSQRIPGCHEIVAHPNYIVLYRVTDRIEVVAVVHARRARMPNIDRG